MLYRGPAGDHAPSPATTHPRRQPPTLAGNHLPSPATTHPRQRPRTLAGNHPPSPATTHPRRQPPTLATTHPPPPAHPQPPPRRPAGNPSSRRERPPSSHRPPNRPALQPEAPDSLLVPPEMVGELVAHGPGHLSAQEVRVVSEIPYQGVAEDHDPIVEVVLRHRVALVEAVGAPAIAAVGDDH